MTLGDRGVDAVRTEPATDPSGPDQGRRAAPDRRPVPPPTVLLLQQNRFGICELGTLSDPEAAWSNSTVVGGYAADRPRALRDEMAGHLYVSSSATLVQALLADGLVDELHLYVYPVAVGTGIRLFPDGAPRTPLSLLGVESLNNGVAHLTYGPAPAAG